MEVVEEEDVVSNRALSKEHYLLFFVSGGQAFVRGGEPKAKETL